MLSQIANPKSDFNKVNMTSSEKMYPFKQKKKVAEPLKVIRKCILVTYTLH